MAELNQQEWKKRWERLLDWIAVGVPDEMSDEQIADALKGAGINMEPAYARLHEMVDRYRRETKGYAPPE